MFLGIHVETFFHLFSTPNYNKFIMNEVISYNVPFLF